MRRMTFAKRCAKEILRDPLNLLFGLGFPLVLLLLLSAIQANIPVHLFEIDTLTPGITVFGLSFVTLFSATLIARDRETALLQRLYTTPLTAPDFILGYLLPVLLMGYLSTDTLVEYDSLTQLGAVLQQNGWTALTAVATMPPARMPRKRPMLSCFM